MLFCIGTSEAPQAPFCFYLHQNNVTAYLVFICAATNRVNNNAISVRTATLSYSCIRACIGFALKPAEPLNGFLRALFEIPLTSRQGVGLSFLWFLFSQMGQNKLMYLVIGEAQQYHALNVIGFMLIFT